MLLYNGFDWIIKGDKTIVYMRSHWGTLSLYIMSPKAFSEVKTSFRYRKVHSYGQVIKNIFEVPIQDIERID